MVGKSRILSLSSFNEFKLHEHSCKILQLKCLVSLQILTRLLARTIKSKSDCEVFNIFLAQLSMKFQLLL